MEIIDLLNSKFVLAFTATVGTVGAAAYNIKNRIKLFENTILSKLEKQDEIILDIKYNVDRINNDIICSKEIEQLKYSRENQLKAVLDNSLKYAETQEAKDALLSYGNTFIAYVMASSQNINLENYVVITSTGMMHLAKFKSDYNVNDDALDNVTSYYCADIQRIIEQGESKDKGYRMHIASMKYLQDALHLINQYFDKDEKEL